MDADTSEIKAWCRLLRAPGLGPARIRRLLQHFGSASAAVAASFRGWRECQGSGFADLEHGGCGTTLRVRNMDAAVDADMQWLSATGHSLLRCTDPLWPALLDRIPDPPAALFVRGDAGCLWRPQVAVVGSRHATRGGLEHARTFAGGLARRGFTITSGFARGVDVAAHHAALQAGGTTIALCGTGLDVDYPRDSRDLATEIAGSGAMVSEHGPGAPPLAAHFPQRNRLISGLALGTLVVEAGLRSGSLITARLAAEQGREVFAIPGSIGNVQARGCHALIRDGARLVESVEEIQELLRPMAAELAATIRSELGGDAAIAVAVCVQAKPACSGQSVCPDTADASAGTRIGTSTSRQTVAALRAACPAVSPGPQLHALLHAIGFDPVTLDELIESTGLDAATIAAGLLTLELEGTVESLPGARYVRLRSL